MNNNSGLYMARKRARPAPVGYTEEQLDVRRAKKRYEKHRLARANFIPMPKKGKMKAPKPQGVAFFTKRWTAARQTDAWEYYCPDMVVKNKDIVQKKKSILSWLKDRLTI